MLIHQFLHWPGWLRRFIVAFCFDLLGMATQHTPTRKEKLAPVELFCSLRLDCRQLRRSRVWGSPTYVLDPACVMAGTSPSGSHVLVKPSSWDSVRRTARRWASCSIAGRGPSHPSTMLFLMRSSQRCLPISKVISRRLGSTFTPSRERITWTAYDPVDGPIPALHRDWKTDSEQRAEENQVGARRRQGEVEPTIQVEVPVEQPPEVQANQFCHCRSLI